MKRTCTKCKLPKDEQKEFYKTSKHKGNGYQTVCKACMDKRVKERRKDEGDYYKTFIG